jgi:hypothetical protein
LERTQQGSAGQHQQREGGIMTLKEMHKRLGDIIESHAANGWSERNDQPVIVVVQNPKYKRDHDMHIGIERVAFGSYGINVTSNDPDITWVTEAKGTIHKF